MKTLEQAELYVELFYGGKPSRNDWRDISEIRNLPLEFISKYSENLDWNILVYSQKLPEEMIEFYSKKLDWTSVCRQQNLSEKFIEKHCRKLGWNHICWRQKLSEEFIERNTENVDWTYVSEYQELSEEFIEKFWHKLDKVAIADFQRLSENFIKKHEVEIYRRSWLYKSKEFKKKAVERTNEFKCFENHFIAYAKKTDEEVGTEISCFCDCIGVECCTRVGLKFFANPEENENFEYIGDFSIVAIKYDDLGVIFGDSGRCRKLTILS